MVSVFYFFNTEVNTEQTTKDNKNQQKKPFYRVLNHLNSSVINTNNNSNYNTFAMQQTKEQTALRDLSPLEMEVSSVLESAEKEYLIEKKEIKTDAPMTLFQQWFNIAGKHPWIEHNNAMCLATVNAQNQPSARYVLLKGKSSHFSQQKTQQKKTSSNYC